MTKAGFIGLGRQGRYLAENLARAGYDLMVYDVRAEACAPLAAAGAQVARSCAEVAAHASIVAVCVLDDAQLEDVILGSGGIAESAKPGTIVVSHSTVRPKTIDKLHVALAERGLAFVDSPVSGGAGGALNKTMSYMVGGESAAVDACVPLFETSGTKITRTGGPGTGVRAKISHQLILCVNMLGASEGMRLGVAGGLTPEVLERTISAGAAQSWAAEGWSKKDRRSGLPLWHKDLAIALEYADDLGIAVPGAALAKQLLDTVAS